MKAKRKLKLAEETSDVQTENDSQGTSEKPKRRRLAVRKLYDSSDSELDEEPDDKIPRPPPVKTLSNTFESRRCKYLQILIQDTFTI